MRPVNEVSGSDQHELPEQTSGVRRTEAPVNRNPSEKPTSGDVSTSDPSEKSNKIDGLLFSKSTVWAALHPNIFAVKSFLAQLEEEGSEFAEFKDLPGVHILYEHSHMVDIIDGLKRSLVRE